MARVLHLWKGGDLTLAHAVIAQQLASGDEVTVGVLADPAPDPLPAGVIVHRFGDDPDYAALLDLLFAADHVITW
jgi:hypothetical protein